MSGRCRFCGCSELNACPGGCSWIDARQNVCSACEAIAAMWEQLPRRMPNMVHAFFRGFVQATGDPRAARFVVITDARGGEIQENPYPLNTPSAKFWQLGFDAGEQLAVLLS